MLRIKTCVIFILLLFVGAIPCNRPYQRGENMVSPLHVNVCFAQDKQEKKNFFVAQKSFEDGFYDASAKLFEEFLIDYPYSTRKIEASLYIAKSLFFQKKYQECLTKFHKFLGMPEAGPVKDEVIFWIAECCFKLRNYKDASYYYQRLIVEFPHSKYKVNAYYSNGFCFFVNDNYREAIRTFNLIRQEFPGSPLAEEASFKIIECFYNLKDFKNLNISINTFLEDYPKSKKINYIYYYRGEFNYYNDNFREADSDFNLCLERSKGDSLLESIANLGLGWVNLRLERFDQAEKSFLKVDADVLDSKSKESLLLGKAILFAKTNKADQAQKLFDSIINTSKDRSIILEAYVAKGDLLYSESRFKDAASFYKEAINRFSGQEGQVDIDKLYYGLAWVYLKLGNFKEATLEFQKVISESSNKIIKISALCQLADTYQEQGKLVEAIEKYDQILRDYPDNFYSDYAQYQLGVALLKLEKYDSAILAFGKLNSDFPNSKLRDSGSYSLGLAYFKKGDYIKSKEYFLSLYQNFPDSRLRHEALYLAGVSCYNQGNFSEAIKIFKNLLKEKKLDSELLVKTEYELADCFLRAGDQKEALKRFRALNAKYPNSFLADDILFWLGEYFSKELKFNLSRNYFLMLIKKYPKSPLVAQCYYNIGYTYIEEGNLDEAKKYFSKLKKEYKDKNSILAQIALIDIDAEEGKLNEAIRGYNRLLEYNNEFSKLIYIKLADVYKKSNNFNKALEIYRKLQSDSIDPYVEFQIAECLEENKDFDNAIKGYLSVSYSYPEDKALVLKCLLRAGKILEEQEKWSEAKNIYQKVSDMDFEEAKFAKEKINWIDSFTKKK